MQKQTQFVGRLVALGVLFSLSGCNAWDSLMAKADKEIAKAIAKADKKSEEAAEADKAAAAKVAIRREIENVNVLLADINKSNVDLSRVALAVKPLFEQVAQAAPKPAGDTPTCFVGLVAVVVPAEKGGGEPQVLPLYLVNNQALSELDHQILVVQQGLTAKQVERWQQARSLLIEQLDQLVRLLCRVWVLRPDLAEQPRGFLGHVVEMHLDNEERAQVYAAAKGAKEPVPAWFEQASMLGLTPAAKKLLAE